MSMNLHDTILHGDALALLRTLPSESVQCCVTSPPYWSLRDYGTVQWEGGDDPACSHSMPLGDGGAPKVAGYDKPFRTGNQYTHQRVTANVCKCGAVRIDRQLGLEATPDEYVARMVEVFREVRRVLRNDGTCWVNMGDGYAASMTSDRRMYQPTRDTARSGGVATLRAPQIRGARTAVASLKAKDLIGMPWRLAFALQADGWYLRADIIWHKPNPMPESVSDRPTKAHEYLFLLSKRASYYYDAEAIREPHDQPWRGFGERDGGVARATDGIARQAFVVPTREYNPAGRNKRSVWTVATHSFAQAHFATFPPKLIEPCILAGAPAGGLVLDPFMGAGTVGVVCRRHSRHYLGIELNAAYIAMAQERIANEVQPALWTAQGGAA